MTRQTIASRFALFCLAAVLAAGVAAQDAVFRSDVRLVEVYATVTDHQGKYIDGLTRERFTLSENGAAQPVTSFENQTNGVSCALLLDTTGSMQNALPAVKNAALRFIDGLRPGDEIAVYAFTTTVETLQDFTADRDAAKRAVLRTRAQGATALFDSVSEVSRDLERRQGKKALVVFTDGDDNSSLLQLRGAIDRAKKTGIPVYAIAEGEALHSRTLLKNLAEISTSTGGSVYEAKKIEDIGVIFEKIVSDLRHLYLLTYAPGAGDQVKWRSIQVAVNGLPQYRVRAREGYFPR
jgi:Ca-activated chloride channel homolog